MPEDWKIERRKPHCGACNRDFDSEEIHYSGILETPEGFARRDYCLACWDGRRDELFSYWKTQSPIREERKLENVQAMADFFTRLVSEPLEDPTRRKVAYLVSLLLMRRRRIKLISSSRGWLDLEKAWDGETVRIPDPVIAEGELDSLKGEMENLFNSEMGSVSPVS